MNHLQTEYTEENMLDKVIRKSKIYLYLAIGSSILLALAGIFLPILGLSIAGILGVFVTGRACRYELIHRRRARLTSVGLAVGICIIGGSLAGAWQFMLCKLWLDYNFFEISTHCGIDDIWTTSQSGILFSVFIVLMWVIRMLFYKSHD